MSNLGNSTNSSPNSTTSISSNSTSSSNTLSSKQSTLSPNSLTSSNSNITTSAGLSASQSTLSPLSSSASNIQVTPKSYNSDHITISYQDDTRVWNFVEPELQNHLPLRNITWKTKTGSTKVVERMPIEILHYDDERIKNPQQELYRKPYLYLYLIHCDDADSYKNTIKSKIKTWINTMTERQQEWLIVYVSVGVKRFSELTSKLTRTVYDRIKNDFNVKRDRCCQLRFFDDNNKYEDLWDDFLVKMKEGIISSAEQYLTCYEDEIRKLDTKRILPGWSYLNFFYVKESLAFIYERAQLYEDALIQYYELEVLFTDNSSQFEVISPIPEFNESIKVLDISKKVNYRELIQSGKISLFDFKHYLFARQTKLLFLLQKPIEVASKALVFLTSVSIIIKRYTPKYFKPLFKESWTFSASMEIIKACQESFEKIISSNKETSSILGSGTTKAKSSTTPSITKFFGNALGSLGKVNNQIQSTLSIPTGSQSLTALQSTQLTALMQQQQQQSSGGGTWNRQSLNLSELESRIEKQDKETLDFLLGDMLFNASQKLEEIAVQLNYLSPNIDNLLSSEELQQPIIFHKIIDNLLNSIEVNSSNKNSTTTEIIEEDETKLLELFPNYPFLRESFKSKKEFQRIYIDILNQSEKLYTTSNRVRSISRLSYSLGNYHFRLKQFQESELILKSIYPRESLWTEIEYAIKTKLSYSQKKLGHIQDYVNSCVSLLTPGILKNQEERLYYLEELYKMSVVEDLNVVQPMAPLFKSKVHCSESLFRYLDTIKIHVRIQSNLTSPVQISSGVVSFIKATPNSPNEKLNFTLNDFELNPGINQLVFTTIASSKSSFIKDSIWLKINNISFRHSLRGDLSDKSEIKIIDSESLITLESFTNNPLLLGTVQYIGIKLLTHQDQIETGILSFYSMTGVTIIQTTSFNVIRTSSDGISRIEEIQLINDKLPLSQISSNEIIEFYLPVMAINTDTCTHQIRVELQHQKQTKEKFSSSLISSTLFINPFSIQEQFIPVNNQPNHLFLKLLVQCTSSTMLQLSDYQLENCDSQYQEVSNSSFYLVKDYNKSLSDIKLYPGQIISMIFEIKRYQQQQKQLESLTTTTEMVKDCKIHLKYLNKHPDTDSTLIKECKPLWKDSVDFNWTIKFYSSLSYYQVDIKIPEIGHIGSLVPFEFTIVNLRKQSEPESSLNHAQYQIEFDTAIWMISGRSKFSFYIGNEKSLDFKCYLIPITTGPLPVPRISLLGVNPQNIIYPKNYNQSIYVYPTSQLFTCQLTTNSNIEPIAK